MGSPPRNPALWAAFALTLCLFFPTLASFPDVWQAQPYTHGYLIALASVWLIRRDREALRPTGEPWPPAVPVALAVSLLWFVAYVARARMPTQAVLPALLLLWTAAVLGARVATRLVPVAGVFLLAVPVWGILTRPLQSLTVLMSGGAVRLLGVPARIEGDLIHIEAGTFLVAGGCAGLNYLMSGLTVGALYAMTVPLRPRGRAAVVGLAALLAIVGNWVRVAGLVVLGHTTEMQASVIAEPIPHLLYGWAIFVVGLAVFFAVVGRLAERFAPEPEAAAGEAGAPAAAGAAEASAGTPAPPTPAGVRPALLATLAVGAGPLLAYALGALPVTVPSEPALSEVPSDWSPAEAGAGRPYTWVPDFPGADRHVSTIWTDGADRVVVDRLIYDDQEQGAELIGYASRIAPEGDVLSPTRAGMVGPARRLVNAAVVRSAASPVLVWYWYRVGGVDTTSRAKAKLLEVWAFLRRATRSELVAVSTPCGPTDCAEASRVLGRFFGAGDPPAGS